MPEPKAPDPETVVMHPVEDRKKISEAFRPRRVKRNRLWGY
jgi:hypothetical protein